MWLFLLWWLVDDHIAEAMNAPGIGSLPIWVPLVIGLAFSFTFSANVDRRWKHR
jgi:hypothetical protein